MTRTIIDIHVLQTVPPSNINRDDTGSPKTAWYGGVQRARVSSQAWKRAVRLRFIDTLDRSELGERTLRVGEALATRIVSLAPDLADRSYKLAEAVLKAAGIAVTTKEKKGSPEPAYAESKYLLFLSNRQVDNLAAAAIESARGDGKLDGPHLKKLANQDHSVDIAMFGRMVADLTDINVDAAVQVAHALSVHAVENEFDYFTAVDDRKQAERETGAGMIGTVEFNSSTLYRYATIDVDRLHDNLGNAAATRSAVEAFVKAFVTSMPTGKQNTFANRTLPDAVLVRMRDSQPISFVGAFEEPVKTNREVAGRVASAAGKLATYVGDVESAYGEKPVAAWVTRVGDATRALADFGDSLPLDEMATAVGAEVGTRIGAP